VSVASRSQDRDGEAGVSSLLRYRRVEDIVGDLLRLRAKDVALGDLAVVESTGRSATLARAVELDGDVVVLQVFGGTKGLATDCRVQFLGRPMDVAFSRNVLGRIFRGSGATIDGGPSLNGEPRAPVAGPPVNPVMRVLARRMIRTRIPMIDVFNCLVESQKIPIFTVPGEPSNVLLARIAFQADADLIVFGGLGLLFDDYHFFRTSFEDRGVFHRAVMFVNLASDPVVERLLVPDLALAVAERFAADEGKRVLVLLTDMTSYADALKEVGIAMEHIPANRGYLGDLYTQLARRYEKACDFRDAGSVTILAVTTMPGNDVTHPVPDTTGYITEGQLYLHDGMIDPFGSLSRLKQHVIGHVTREDHGPLADALIRLYAEAQQAEQKRAMAFELGEHDRRLLRYAELFRARFMDLNVDMELERALDTGWATLAECFAPSEIAIRPGLMQKYWPRPG
jgi:V/A-type H+-transporting ATPase subunit B